MASMLHQRLLAKLRNNKIAVVIAFVVDLQLIKYHFTRDLIGHCEANEHDQYHEADHRGDAEHDTLFSICCNKREESKKDGEPRDNEVPLVVLPRHAVEDHGGSIDACEVYLAVDHVEEQHGEGRQAHTLHFNERIYPMHPLH